LIQKSFY